MAALHAYPAENCSRNNAFAVSGDLVSNPDEIQMKFANHLFISYAWLDNERTEPKDPGWVDRFHDSLKAYLSTSLGEKPIIWRDLTLRGNEALTEEISEQLPKTALLVSILSPRYFESPWCLKEIEEFCRIAEEQGGLVIDNKMRNVRVLLRPVDDELREKLPGRLKDQLGYRFYAEREGGKFERLDPRFGDEVKAAFTRQISILADELAETINRLEEQENSDSKSKPAEPEGPPKPVVYLAECSWDRGDDREKIRAELWGTGYTVLPEAGTRLPQMEADYAAEVDRLLDGCRLSIHMVGANGGAVLNGPGRIDAVQLQNEIAARKSDGGRLSRLIWLPATSSTQPEQQSFIDALRSKAELQRGADLIEDGIEGLKSGLRITLEKLEEPPAKNTEQTKSGTPLIYLICLDADRPATIPLRKFLKAQGFDVQLPLFEGDAAAVRQSHEDLLTKSDAALVFYGAGNEAWKRTTDADLQKSKSYRRGVPLAIFTYLAPPLTSHKQDYIDMGEERLIVGLEKFTEPALQPLIDTLKRA